MGKHIGFTGLWLWVALMAMVVACSPSVKVPEPVAAEPGRSVEGPSLELFVIDSLMWRQPDSALTQLQAFCNSPEADSLDEFNGHYCQLLISELLYKNDYVQSNRKDLLKAVDYFDSIDDGFLAARAHYINGVGFYEKGDVVNACAEYLKTLEVMEAHFEENELAGHKARFLAYTYNRLGDLFSEQFMMESAITCYENALVYCKISPTSPIGIPNILYRIGKQYDKKNEIENASLYYGQALENMAATENIVYRNIVASKALCDYGMNGDVKQALDKLNYTLIHAKTDNERLNRYLTIGGIHFLERNYDSAIFYLEPVFEDNDAGLQTQAAGYLRIVYDSIGDVEKSNVYMRFLTNQKKPDGENKALVSKLEDMFKTYTNQKKEKEAEEARKKSIKRTIEIIIPIAVVVALAIIFIVRLKGRKMLKQQQNEAERALKAKDSQHERELKAKQDEALRQMEAARQSHEEEVKRLQATVEQSSQHQREVLQQRVLAIYKTGVEDRLQRILDEFESAYPSAAVRLEQACPNLNETERRIVILSFLGFRAKEVADLLGLKENTVTQYRSNLKKKADIDGLSASIG